MTGRNLPPRRRKSSTLVVATKSPGTCAECRHANQGTADFAEGKAFCWIAKTAKRRDQTCDVALPLTATVGRRAPASTYYLFEPFDGTNGTYDVSEDLRILAEDADDELRKSLRADEPIIPGEPA